MNLTHIWISTVQESYFGHLTYILVQYLTFITAVLVFPKNKEFLNNDNK